MVVRDSIGSRDISNHSSAPLIHTGYQAFSWMAQATAIRIAPNERNKVKSWRKFIGEWELLASKRTQLNKRIDDAIVDLLKTKGISMPAGFPGCSDAVMPALQADLMMNRVLKNKPEPSTPLGIRFAPLLMKIETEGNAKYGNYSTLVVEIRAVLDQTELSETIESDEGTNKEKPRANAVWVVLLEIIKNKILRKFTKFLS